jgi:hypothetical protein
MKRLSSSAHNEVVLANFMQPAGTGRRTDQAAQIGTRLSSARSCARRQCGGEKEKRGFIKLNLVSLALTGGAILALLVAIGAIVVLLDLNARPLCVGLRKLRRSARQLTCNVCQELASG